MKVYLDSSSTTKPSQECINDFLGCVKLYNNPSSTYCNGGILAHNMLEEARAKIANYIGAKLHEVHFTSGASESNNWAIKNWLFEALQYDFETSFWTTNIEHSSVYQTMEWLSRFGFDPYYLKVDSQGFAPLEDVNEYALTINPFVSIILANNEIGTIQKPKEIKRICNIVHQLGGWVHIDATQALTHIPVNVEYLGCDSLSASAHKFGCFSGIGFLYVNQRNKIQPLIHGGKQEDGLRAGTENFNYIIPMANQIERLSINEQDRWKKEREIRNKINYNLYEVCAENQVEMLLNGPALDSEYRLPNNLNVTLKGIDSSALITLLDERGIQISAGSACNSGTNKPSRVLKAIGLTDEAAQQTIRISVDSSITDDQIEYFVKEVDECLKLLK